MSASADLLEMLQADVFAILKNTPALAAANVLSDNQGDIESRVLKAFGTATETGGKCGLVLVVLLPEVTEAEANLPGPPLRVKVEIRALENVTINRSAAKGTLIRSSQAALHALGALHQQVLGGHALYAEKDPLTPVDVKPGHVSHAVTLYARANGLTGPGKVLGVSVSEVNDIITLTCATDGASIYYTTDGSYPTPTNGTLYTAPITDVTVGDTWRVAAYKTGLNPSDCLEFIVAVPAGAVTDGDFVITDADDSALTDL